VGAFYIVVRTFPFWAIPLGISLIFYFLKPPGGKRNRYSLPLFLLGILLVVGAVLYFVFEGYRHAVPAAYEVLSSPLAAPPAGGP